MRRRTSGGDGKGYIIAYEHSLSKRTHLYAGYVHVFNGDTTTRFNFRENLAITAGKSVSAVEFGVSHMF